MLSQIEEINPYEHLYRNLPLKISENITEDEITTLVMHLGFAHNTIGIMIKDFIKVMSFKCKKNQSNSVQVDNKQKNDKNDKTAKASSKSVKFSTEIQKRPTQKIVVKENYKSTFDDFSFDSFNIQENNKKEKSKDSKTKFQSNAPENTKKPPSVQASERIQIQKPSKDSKEQNESKVSKVQREFSFEYEFNEGQNKNSNSNPSKEKQRAMDVEQNTINGFGLTNRFMERSYNKQEEESVHSKSNQQFLRINPGRTKKERQKLGGISCPDCQQFYNYLGGLGEKACKCASRHRSNVPMMPKQLYRNLDFSQEFHLD